MNGVSDRHESDLSGKFRPFADTEVRAVTVVVSPHTAHLASVQHTAWMLVNLLARLEGVVGQIGFVCLRDTPITGRVVPLVPAEREFRAAVLQGAAVIDIVPVIADTTSGLVLEVGTSVASTSSGKHPIDGRLYVYGEGWWGGISQGQIKGSGRSPLPFGPYTAASLAVAEVFKVARMYPDSFEPVRNAFYSTWLHQAGTVPLPGGPDLLDDVPLDVVLAGVGAVGSTWVHALWACPGVVGRALLADNDPAGIDRTNLNRYPLFGMNSVGQPKASEAVCICGHGPIEWVAHDGPFEEVAQIPPRVISAVDTNRARAAIQQRYPARILSASTLDLRAEVQRCGPPGIGACLRCYNPPEPIASDEEIRARLGSASDDARVRVADEAGVSKEELDSWVQTGRCGQASARLLPFIRQSGSGTPPAFAVSFVSAMAGTLLAAETVKDHFAVGVPLSDELSRAVLQFWTPAVRTNRASAYKQDENCPMCDPTVPATIIWRKRFYGLHPMRQPRTGFDAA